MKTIAVIDYGMGNLRSVVKALEHVSDRSSRVLLTSESSEIRDADRVVFPGQGAAAECMAALQRHELTEAVLEAARNKPFLGVCMGLQVLLTASEENGNVECLDFLPGKVEFFGSQPELQRPEYKIPHMGWNEVCQVKVHTLWQDIPDKARFYFVHSYYVNPASVDVITGVTGYGMDFASAVSRENIFAVQFHPEKSAANGLQLLQNFVNWDGAC